MKHLLYFAAGALLFGSNTTQATVIPEIEDAIIAAYELGRSDAFPDDIGLVRLTLKDIEGML